MSDNAAETTLRSVTNWSRYGELFAFDEKAQVFSLENPS
jgi:NitT/TauT family transport system ATP-binding protein